MYKIKVKNSINNKIEDEKKGKFVIKNSLFIITYKLFFRLYNKPKPKQNIRLSLKRLNLIIKHN